MAGLNGSIQSNPNIKYTLDPKSLILSQFASDPNKPNLLELKTESFFMERGPRYKAYADLRESKLRLKNSRSLDSEPTLTPPRKQVNFAATTMVTQSRRKGSSIIAQSVPDFAAVLRKENRKPAPMLTPVMEKSMTPPAGSKSSKMYGIGAKSGGSKSVNSGEKRNGGIMGRKSNANLEELKGLSSAAANAINYNAENRGGRIGRGIGRTILGYKQ